MATIYLDDFIGDDFITIEAAYEFTVRKLAPETRPGDDYLIGLAEEELYAAYARIDEAERVIEAKLRNALANHKLSVWRFDNSKYKLERVPTWKEWRRPAFGVPSVGFEGYYDPTINEFLQPSPPGNKNFYVKQKDFNSWLRQQRRRKPKGEA
jgi:hypothetical protein